MCDPAEETKVLHLSHFVYLRRYAYGKLQNNMTFPWKIIIKACLSFTILNDCHLIQCVMYNKDATELLSVRKKLITASELGLSETLGVHLLSWQHIICETGTWGSPDLIHPFFRRAQPAE